MPLFCLIRSVRRLQVSRGKTGSILAAGHGISKALCPMLKIMNGSILILYLWRKELANAGGAGKYRGGNSGELAFIPYGTDHINLFTASGYCAVPGPGLHGGLSPATTRFTLRKDANVAQQLVTTGRMPTSLEELQGKTEYIAPKAFNVPQRPADAFLLSWAGAGGYGDPLERDPVRVMLDIQRGNVTAEWATEVYGVIFDEQGQVDTKRTDARRNTLRKARIRKVPKRARQEDELDPRAPTLLRDYCSLRALLACSKCAHEIGPAARTTSCIAL